MALWKLNQTPIWQDEAMEFYCSLPIKGAIRGVTQYESMYERMAYIQQQPPLYNWIMCIWLKVNEGEWWFRFSSVVFGFGAVIGLYFVIKKLCNQRTAILSIFVFSSMYPVMYYIKEASEYSLLMMFMFWLIYSFVCVIDNKNTRNIIVFTILCVLNIYTHYGSAFVIIPMAIAVLVNCIKNKSIKELRTSLIAYTVAIISAGIPLFVFYVIPQAEHMRTAGGTDKAIEITGGNIVTDFFNSIMCVLRWSMLDYDRDAELFTPFMWILTFALLVSGMVVFVRTKKRAYRYLALSSVFMYLIYYVIVKFNIYSYGWYGNRYNIFIIPIWFVLICVMAYEFIGLIKSCNNIKISKMAKIATIVTVMVAILYCCYGVKRVNDHWGKMDLRTVTTQWYSDEGYEIPTFVNYHQRYSFVYYMTHNESYSETMWDNVWCNENLDSLDYSDEEWIDYLEKDVYPEGIPDRLYVISGQYDTIVVALESYGYSVEPIVDTTAKMYLLTK
jgi:uncharacterized membrane protein